MTLPIPCLLSITRPNLPHITSLTLYFLLTFIHTPQQTTYMTYIWQSRSYTSRTSFHFKIITHTLNKLLHSKCTKNIILKLQLYFQCQSSKNTRVWITKLWKTLLCPQASHLGLLNSHPTSIIERWCFRKPIALSRRLHLISNLENSLLYSPVASSS